MTKCVDTFKKYLRTIHTGRADPSLLANIKVESYGSLIPLSQLANIVTENSHTLAITVFNPSIVLAVEKAIIGSNHGLNPLSTGTVIYVQLPILTEERRRTLIKKVRAEAEQSRILLRNLRRDANTKIKALLKEKQISVDEDRRYQEDIQKLTNTWIKTLDQILAEKEVDLMTC